MLESPTFPSKNVGGKAEFGSQFGAARNCNLSVPHSIAVPDSLLYTMASLAVSTLEDPASVTTPALAGPAFVLLAEPAAGCHRRRSGRHHGTPVAGDLLRWRWKALDTSSPALQIELSDTLSWA